MLFTPKILTMINCYKFFNTDFCSLKFNFFCAPAQVVRIYHSPLTHHRYSYLKHQRVYSQNKIFLLFLLLLSICVR